jgi:hypothetical protein
MEVPARVELWGFMAFWLWLGFALVFIRLRILYAALVAAVMSWIAAGLLVM